MIYLSTCLLHIGVYTHRLVLLLALVREVLQWAVVSKKTPGH